MIIVIYLKHVFIKKNTDRALQREKKQKQNITIQL